MELVASPALPEEALVQVVVQLVGLTGPPGMSPPLCSPHACHGRAEGRCQKLCMKLPDGCGYGVCSCLRGVLQNALSVSPGYSMLNQGLRLIVRGAAQQGLAQTSADNLRKATRCR